MNRPLKQSVREHIDSYALDNDQLHKLESLDVPAAATAERRLSMYPFAIAGAAAAFLLAFFLAPLMVGQGDMHERIAMEVATNHIKLKPLEIETHSIDGIRDYFKKLDFIPVSSKLVSDSGLELIGGRYCSLQGITAAQLRVRKPGSHVIQTLYQTEYRKDVFDDMPVLEEGHEPVDIYVKGIKVNIWVEKGLLFALTDLPDDRN